MVCCALRHCDLQPVANSVLGQDDRVLGESGHFVGAGGDGIDAVGCEEEGVAGLGFVEAWLGS